MANGDNITWENLSGLFSGQPQPGATATSQTAPAQTASFDDKTEQSLSGLQPDFADRARQWIQGMRDNGYDPVLHYGFRTPEEQQVLYEKHLAGGPQAVPPQMSYHTYGRAFDWVNRDSQGNLQWNNDKAYEFGQKLAKSYGLTGIGASDNDHIQDAKYKSWKDLPREDFGVRGRQVASQSTANIATANTSTGSTSVGGTEGGITWENLNALMQR